MNDDTTGISRHIGQWVAVDPAAVYAFAADPKNLSRWAAGLADPGLGDVSVQFAPANDFGVLDHVVELPTGARVYNPMRVIPAGPDQPGCEVVFTLRRLAGVTDAAFEADAAVVTADLDALRQLLETEGQASEE